MQSMGSVYAARPYDGRANQRHGRDFCGGDQLVCRPDQLENHGQYDIVASPRSTVSPLFSRSHEQGFTLVTLSFLIILTNSALWNLRSRASSEPAPPHYPPPQYLPQPPQDSHIPHGTEAAAAPQIGWETAKKKGWW